MILMNFVENKESIESNDKIIAPFEKPDKEFEVEKITDLKKKPIYSFVKRVVDIIVSLVGIAVLFIPMIIVCIVIAATSKGNPIYKQERLGKKHKKFFIYKFRTMYADAEKNGAQWSKGEEDDRITPVGKVLRRLKLDEIPQLFNCLKGDLSLVGPRPEREIFYNYFETYVHGFSQRLLVKPGITGLAQISGGYDLKPEEKIIYDVEYIKNRSIWMDIKIIFKTASTIVSGEGSK